MVHETTPRRQCFTGPTLSPRSTGVFAPRRRERSCRSAFWSIRGEKRGKREERDEEEECFKGGEDVVKRGVEEEEEGGGECVTGSSTASAVAMTVRDSRAEQERSQRLTRLLCSQPRWWYEGEPGQVSCHPATPSTAHAPTPTFYYVLYSFVMIF